MYALHKVAHNKCRHNSTVWLHPTVRCGSEKEYPIRIDDFQAVAVRRASHT